MLFNKSIFQDVRMEEERVNYQGQGAYSGLNGFSIVS